MSSTNQPSNEPSFWNKIENGLNKVADKLDNIFTPEDKNKEGQNSTQSAQQPHNNHHAAPTQNQQNPPPLPPKATQSTSDNQGNPPKEEKGLMKDLEKAGSAIGKFFDDLGDKLDKAIDGDKSAKK